MQRDKRSQNKSSMQAHNEWKRFQDAMVYAILSAYYVTIDRRMSHKHLALIVLKHFIS